MALYTTADRDAVKSALITAATSGIASVSLAGQSVQQYTLDQLRMLLKEIVADLASDNVTVGMRFRKTIPPEAG